MRINSLSSFPDQGSVIDKVLEAPQKGVASGKSRRDNLSAFRTEFQSFSGLVDHLGGSLEGLRNEQVFKKFKVESSDPSVLNADIVGKVDLGSYEFEVRDLARADRHLAFGFEDVDKTSVGFGFMNIQQGDLDLDITVDPDATLQDVTQLINEKGGGAVKAQIVNTGFPEEPFRLLVSSTKTGEAARIRLDEDTTFMEFKDHIKGSNLDMSFEDVQITRAENSFNDLLPGLKLNAKSASPGEKVQINVTQDVDQTMTGIKEFTSKYNEIMGFGHKQYQIDPSTGKGGQLAGDSTMRSTMRRLQSAVSAGNMNPNEMSLAAAGITTNAKTGSLEIDENKLKTALTNNYEGVSKLFAGAGEEKGLAQKLSDTIKVMKDRENGSLTLRMKGLDQRIKQQDMQIQKQEESLADKRAKVEQSMARLDAKMAGLQTQGQFVSAYAAQANASGNAGPSFGGLS